MKLVGKVLLYALVGAGLFVGGALLSVQLSRDTSPDGSTRAPTERASGPSDGYEPPAPEDTPCLQREYVTRCIGRAAARTGLMELVRLQEERMRARGAYATDAAALGFRPESGMVLRMRGGPDGWTAAYQHTASGMGCAVYDGDVEDPFTTVGGGVPESAGAVACDDPLATGR